MNIQHDNPYGLVRRVSSSENHRIPATDLAALFAYSELDILKRAVREIGMARDHEAVDEAVARFAARQEKGLTSIRRVEHVRAREFVAEIDNLRVVPDEMFAKPKIAWLFGSVAGMVAVTSAAAMAQSIHLDPAARVAWLRAALADRLAEAEAAWRRHRTQILRAHPQVDGDDPVFELVSKDPESLYYRVPVLPAIVDWVAP